MVARLALIPSAIRIFEPFHDAIVGTRGDHQPATDAVHRLVMARTHRDALVAE